MINGGGTCPLRKRYHDTGFGFNESCFRGWMRLGPLGERYQRLVRVLELVGVEELLPYRGLEDRAALARPFWRRRCWTWARRGRWWSG